eukprot:TRINITY_DN3237_c0_g2_i1.p1 TRINITY_DN3237_c0_g2~~TRINITY_DN3237_c0_g2_i1.p1  ORF type:complete len:551 (+),score=182.93 TRINITY_DN3237_c0_g2_i1:46-1698(+)
METQVRLKPLSERGNGSASKKFKVRPRQGVVKRGSLGMTARRDEQQAKSPELEQARHEIATIVGSMQAAPTDAFLQEISCAALEDYAQQDKWRGRLVVDLAGVDAIAVAMRTHADNALIQEHGCATMAALTMDTKVHNDALLEAGALPLVLEALRAHMANAAIAQQAVAVLRDLASPSPDVVTQIAAADGIRMIVDVFRQYPKDIDVQEPAIHVIVVLAGVSAENLETLLELGAVPDVIAAMMQHSEAARLQRLSCAFLALAGDTGSGRAAVGTEGIKAVLEALRNHDQDVLLFRDACTALRLLTQDNVEHAEFAVENGCIELLNSAVAANDGDMMFAQEADTLASQLASLLQSDDADPDVGTFLVDIGGMKIPMQFKMSAGDDDDDEAVDLDQESVEAQIMRLISGQGIRFAHPDDDKEAGMLNGRTDDSDEDIEEYDDDDDVRAHRRVTVRPPVRRNAGPGGTSTKRRSGVQHVRFQVEDSDEEAPVSYYGNQDVDDEGEDSHVGDSTDDEDDDERTPNPAAGAAALVGATALVAASAFLLYRWWKSS